MFFKKKTKKPDPPSSSASSTASSGAAPAAPAAAPPPPPPPAAAPAPSAKRGSTTLASSANAATSSSGASSSNSPSAVIVNDKAALQQQAKGDAVVVVNGPSTPVSSSAKTAATSASSSAVSGGKSKPTLLTVKSLKDTPAADRPMVFQNHLVLCQQTFNFSDTSSQMREKEAKRQLLLGLVDYTNGTKDVFTESIYPDVIAMLSANLFRDLPVRESEGMGDDEEPMLEPSWPHLQIVYEFLLRFVVSSDVDAKVAKKYISHQFIIQLLELFNSEDPRERDYLKTILHRIYGKYMALRAFIRRAINNVFYRVMYDSERHNGIGELLEILGSIINGFALPLKAEHKRFLVRALIPLHKVKTVGLFHQQLAYCITQFVEKDPKMVEPIILGLLRFWPSSSSPKQVLFLNELEDILELVQPAEFTRIMVPLFRRIDLCLDSPHFQVAERTLFLWNNEYVVSLIAQNKKELLPILFQTLSRNADSHWNVTVHSLTNNVMKLFQEMDKSLFNECKSSMDSERRKRSGIEEDRLKKWRELEDAFGVSDL